MSTSLPLLQFPCLVFERIHSFLTLEDIINLSQCSNRLQTLLKRTKCSHQVKLFINIGSSCLGVLVAPHGSRDRLHFLISREWFKLKDTPINKVAWKINEATWIVEIDKSRNPRTEEEVITLSTVPKENKFEKDFVTLITWLQTLFKCTTENLFLDFTKDRLSQLRLNFDTLFRRARVFHKAKNIYISRCKLEEEEMAFLLNNLVADHLDFDGYYSNVNTFNSRRALHKANTSQTCARGLTAEQLVEVSKNCRLINIRSAEWITSKELNEFLLSWIKNDSRTLEEITVSNRTYNDYFGYPFSKVPTFDKDVVLAGLAHVPSKRENVDEVIVRRADGVKATIRVDDKQFIFTVCYEPDSDDDK